MTHQVYVDMDGVVADFLTPTKEFFGIRPTDSKRDLDTLLNQGKGFLRLQREWPTFWMDLPRMPHALDLWEVVRPYHPCILTALPESWPSAATGKYVWVKRHLSKFGYNPRQEFHAVLRSQKVKFAKQPDGTPNVLIDDFDKNINEWRSAGGIGILYVDSSSAVNLVRTTLRSL